MKNKNKQCSFFPSIFSLILLLSGLPASAGTAPAVPFAVLAQYPHRSHAFTEGLELVDGLLYESSGLYRQSFITAMPLEAGGDALFFEMLPGSVFGEGMTVFKDRIYVLTWKEQRALVYDRKTRKLIREFTYEGEGWGLTHDDKHLIMSNGSDKLLYLDPDDGKVVRTVAVTEDGKPVTQLNELELVDKRILANVWRTDTIVVIDPKTGVVTGRIELDKLYPHSMRSPAADVMNGIAYDPADKTLLVTGKLWPTVYRLRLTKPLP